MSSPINSLRLVLRLSASPTTVMKLAEELEMSPTTTSRQLTQLERKGWIQRTRREENRREVNVALTQHGRKAMSDLGLSPDVVNQFDGLARLLRIECASVPGHQPDPAPVPLAN